MDFPRKAQELGKEAVEIAEVGLCFRWTEGRMGIIWADWGGLGTRSRIFLAPLSVEEQNPGGQLHQDKGLQEQKGCLDPKLAWRRGNR